MPGQRTLEVESVNVRVGAGMPRVGLQSAAVGVAKPGLEHDTVLMPGKVGTGVQHVRNPVIGTVSHPHCAVAPGPVSSAVEHGMLSF